MDENLTEKEQLQQLTQWWHENKMFIISGLVLGASVLFGWNSYKQQKITKAHAAQGLHASLLDAVTTGNADAASAAATQLSGDYGSTPYADLAPLSVARLHVQNGDLAAAASALEGLLNTPGELANVARLRLARIRIAQERAQDALTLLTGDGGAFAPLYSEVRGDAHAALGQAQEAHDAYSAALDSEGQALDRNFVQIKMAALGLGDDSAP